MDSKANRQIYMYIFNIVMFPNERIYFVSTDEKKFMLFIIFQ